ncbi:MAG: hypothetical protein EBT05_18995 [Betaproteobacteria bacterium]|nr:hypothetical protein [Betaproteobacteria bacterium]
MGSDTVTPAGVNRFFPGVRSLHCGFGQVVDGDMPLAACADTACTGQAPSALPAWLLPSPATESAPA